MKEIRGEFLRTLVKYVGQRGGIFQAVKEFYLGMRGGGDDQNIQLCELLMIDENDDDGIKLHTIQYNHKTDEFQTVKKKLTQGYIFKVINQGSFIKESNIKFSDLNLIDQPFNQYFIRELFHPHQNADQISILAYPLYANSKPVQQATTASLTKRNIIGALRLFGSRQWSNKDFYIIQCCCSILGQYIGDIQKHEQETSLTINTIQSLKHTSHLHSQTAQTLRFFFQLLCTLQTSMHTSPNLQKFISRQDDESVFTGPQDTSFSPASFNEQFEMLIQLTVQAVKRVFPNATFFAIYLRRSLSAHHHHQDDQYKNIQSNSNLHRIMAQTIRASRQNQQSLDLNNLQDPIQHPLEIDQEVLLSDRGEHPHKNSLILPLISPSSQHSYGVMLIKKLNNHDPQPLCDNSDALEYQQFMRIISIISQRWECLAQVQSQFQQNLSYLQEQNESLSHDLGVQSLINDLKIELSAQDINSFEAVQGIIQNTLPQFFNGSQIVACNLGMLRGQGASDIVMSGCNVRRREQQEGGGFIIKQANPSVDNYRCATPDSLFASSFNNANGSIFSKFSSNASIDTELRSRDVVGHCINPIQCPKSQIIIPMSEIQGLDQAINHGRTRIIQFQHLAMNKNIGGLLSNIIAGSTSKYNNNASYLNKTSVAFVPICIQKQIQVQEPSRQCQDIIYVGSNETDPNFMMSFQRQRQPIGLMIVTLKPRATSQQIEQILLKIADQLSYFYANIRGKVRMDNYLNETLDFQSQKTLQMKNINSLLLKVNTFLSLQPLVCSTLRDLTLSIGMLIRQTFSAQSVQLWLVNIADKIGVRYTNDRNLPDLRKLNSPRCSSILQYCSLYKINSSGRYIYNSCGDRPQSASYDDPAFSDIFNKEIDIPIKHSLAVKVSSSLSKVIFHDQDNQLCIVAQIINKNYKKNKLSQSFTQHDNEQLSVLTQSLSPLFFNIITGRLNSNSLGTLISAQAIYSSLRSPITLRLASTLRALRNKIRGNNGKQSKKQRRGLLMIQKLVNKWNFKRFFTAQQPNTGGRKQKLSNLCLRKKQQLMRHYFNHFQTQTCKHFWSINVSTVQASVNSENQDYSIRAIQTFLQRRERKSEMNFFKRWKKRYSKDQRAVDQFINSFQWFLRVDHDRQLESAFRRLKRKSTFKQGKLQLKEQTKLKSVFKKWKKKILLNFFKIIKMNSFQISFEDSSSNSSINNSSYQINSNKSVIELQSQKFMKIMTRILNKKNSNIRNTFIRRWMRVTKNHFHSQMQKILNQSVMLSVETQDSKFFNSLFSIVTQLQSQYSSKFSSTNIQKLSVKELTSSLSFRAFFASIRQYLTKSIITESGNVDSIVVTLFYPNKSSNTDNTSSSNKALAIIFRNFNHRTNIISPKQDHTMQRNHYHDTSISQFSNDYQSFPTANYCKQKVPSTNIHFSSNISEISHDNPINHRLHSKNFQGGSCSSLSDLVRNMNNFYQGENAIISGRGANHNNVNEYNNYDLCLTIEQDALLKALQSGFVQDNQVINPFILAKSVPGILNALRSRKIYASGGNALVFPITADNNVIGSIEVYRISTLSDGFTQTESDQMVKFGYNIGSNFVILQNLVRTCDSISRKMRYDQTVNEFMSKMRDITCNSCGGGDSSGGTLSNIIKRATDAVKRAFKAYMCLIIMLPFGENKTGYFYDFSDNHLYNFEYEGTFIEEIIKTKKNAYFTKKQQNLLSITGRQCNKTTYIPILRQGSQSLYGIVQICNSQVVQQQGDKLEYEVARQIQTCIAQYEANLMRMGRQMVRIIGKFKQISVQDGFRQWSQMRRFYEMQNMFSLRKQDAMKLTFAVNQKQSELEQVQKKYSTKQSEISEVTNANSKIKMEMKRFLRDKKSKEKICSCTIVRKVLSQVRRRQLTLYDGFYAWKTKVLCTRIAQAAFNNLLQVNYKHSEVRIQVAFKLIRRALLKVQRRNLRNGWKEIKFQSNFRKRPLCDNSNSRSLSRSKSPYQQKCHGINLQDSQLEKKVNQLVNTSLPTQTYKLAMRPGKDFIEKKEGQAMTQFLQLTQPRYSEYI